MSPLTGSALDFILSQTKANVEFLIAQNHIPPEAGREIINRLAAPSHADPVSSLTDHARNLNISSGPGYTRPTGPSPASNYTPPSNNPRAKAIWGYNEEQTDPNDLSFQPGDIIEIVSETNKDWWTGRFNGREGLFPSNYVEKLPPSVLPPKPERVPSYDNYGPPSGPPAPARAPIPHYGPPPGPPGPGYGHTYHPPIGYQGPPPPGPPGPPQPYPPYASPPPAPASAPPAPAAEPKKESKFGSLGNTLAHSAVGGAGFGAGSAVGSGLINSIF
ncbi:SH3-domain-containing protein [Marasmius fiardii PR-910]|nr:SH3-domain-containing protein [Marasmius fiardii PR-910]